MLTSASSPSELAYILTASDDDSRPATKRELNHLRLNVRAMCTSLGEFFADEVRQRETVDTLMTTRLTALEAQASFQQGALAEPREQYARQGDEIFKMMPDLTTQWLMSGVLQRLATPNPSQPTPSHPGLLTSG